MKIECYVVGMVQTNCYFAVNEETKECVVIDPGDQADKLAEKLEEGGYKPTAILLTHGHFDHIMGVDGLAKCYSIPVYVHEDDKEMALDPEQNSSMMIRRAVSLQSELTTVRDEEVLELAGMKIRVLHTPGHTPGGACYYFVDEEVLFSGDTLFCESVGRTDLYGGSSSQLIRSIREKLMKLPDLTIVYTGHGEPTKISSEKQYNPFI